MSRKRKNQVRALFQEASRPRREAGAAAVLEGSQGM